MLQNKKNKVSSEINIETGSEIIPPDVQQQLCADWNWNPVSTVPPSAYFFGAQLTNVTINIHPPPK
jgi:hypothetical protein